MQQTALGRTMDDWLALHATSRAQQRLPAVTTIGRTSEHRSCELHSHCFRKNEHAIA